MCMVVNMVYSIRSFLAAAFIAGFAAGISADSADFELRDNWIRLRGRGGAIRSLEFDPAGQKAYGPNWIRELRIGDVSPTNTKRLSGIALPDDGLIEDITVARVEKHELANGKIAYPVWSGQRVGQRFRSPFPFLTKVGIRIPTWTMTGSAVTLKLREGGPEGRAIASRWIENLADDQEQVLEFDPLPPGVYYFEASETSGPIGWRGAPGRKSEEQTGIMTGALGDEPVDITFNVSLYGFEPRQASWHIIPDRSTLRWQVDGTTDTQVQLLLPWKRDGYETEGEQFVFRYFLSDGGIYRPVHQFKRRESQELRYDRWVEMCGRDGFDVRFEFASGGVLPFHMDADSMTIRLPLNTKIVLSKHKELGPEFPQFTLSDPALEKTLNQFLLSHAFNFGVDCFPDWKEWQTRILCWSANPEVRRQADYLRKVYPIQPDGYVNTWGDTVGWPFPFEDKDKDGRNDFDTRHFTTNSGLVLGCANHALWSRDPAFIADALPRARRAMEYQLNQLQGETGLLIANAKGHEGKAMGIGSNYWDILPFGLKDAYSNIYFYASLGAMAKLEELASDLGVTSTERGRTPDELRAVREKARAEYQRTFWDDKAGRFVGCVDIDGIAHDYGFTFVNMEAAAYGLADKDQVARIYRWLETQPTATGKADTYSRWIFAPRCSTEFNPPHSIFNPRFPMLPTDKPSWWHFGWRGSGYEDQCQAGGAILYTSYYDVMARVQYVDVENAWRRFREILARYAEPDHLSGGSPLYRGERSQGGPTPGNVGVESEFPESGLVPASFLYAFLGIEPQVEGLVIAPRLPAELREAGVKHLAYAGRMYTVTISRDKDEIAIRDEDPASRFTVSATLTTAKPLVLKPR